jgi:PKD repeat protein
MDYDADLGRVLLTVGSNDRGQPSSQSWTFNGTGWNLLTTNGVPHAHDAGIGVYDPQDHEFVVAAGNQTATTTDVLAMPLAVTNVSVPTEADVGERIAVNGTVAGGTPPRGFSWNWGDGTPDNSTQAASHDFALPGNYTVGFVVSGPPGTQAVWESPVQVRADPVASVSVQYATVDAGVTDNLSASASGGWGGYSFRWELGAVAFGHGNLLAPNWTTPGSRNLTLWAIDEAGGAGSVTSSVVVEPDPTLAIVPDSSVELDQPTTLAAVVTGGIPPLSIYWSLGGGAGASNTVLTGASVQYTFTTLGPQSFGLSLRDGDGFVATASSTVDVQPAVAVAIDGPTALATGATGSFQANISGGATPYVTSWLLPDGSRYNGSVVSYTFGASGSFQLLVSVTDANGAVATSHVAIVVSSPPNTLLPGGQVAGVPTLLLGGLVLGLALVVGLVLWAGRRSRSPPGPDL